MDSRGLVHLFIDGLEAVTGEILGARIGADELPTDWVEKLTVDEEMRQLPDWWPDPDATATDLCSFAAQLQDL